MPGFDLRALNRRAALRLSLGVAAGSVMPCRAGGSQTPVPLNDQLGGNISPVHDPSIIMAGDTYYVFSTDLGGGLGASVPWRFSKDLRYWEKGGFAFAEVPAWAKEAVPGTRGIWAPDISHHDGKYLLYYACSTFGKNTSAIGLATNTTLDPAAPGYKWEDRGVVFQSTSTDDFNAIDPNLVVDRDGNHWLAFGSFWSGIKMVALDPASGKPPAGDKKIYSLASRPPGSDPNAIEAPFIAERGGYYYLFCGFDFCCRGADSNYYTVVGRSANVTGPYSDRDGNAMTYGNATIVLPNNTSSRWRGPGGASILKDAEQYYVVYHAYDALRQGTPTLRIAPLEWSADGWPTAII